jgi:hypothetical protein
MMKIASLSTTAIGAHRSERDPRPRTRTTLWSFRLVSDSDVSNGAIRGDGMAL